MRFHGVIVLGLSVCLAAAGCAPGAAAPEQPPPVHGTLNEVMKGILFPNSNVIFDLQDKDPATPVDPATLTSIYAGVYGGWERVEIAAIALAESASLVTLPGRVCDNGLPVPIDEDVYVETTAGLRDVGMAAYQYAKARAWDEESAFELADQLAQACASCHDVYRDKMENNRIVGLEGRCFQ